MLCSYMNACIRAERFVAPRKRLFKKKNGYIHTHTVIAARSALVHAQRLCAPYLSGGKSSPFPGYTLLPETKAHKKNIGRLAVWLDARANGRGSRDGCASRTRISSDARKIPAAVPLARRDRPATLERASKPSRIDVGGGGLTRAERTKDDGKRAMPARSFGKSGSFSDVGSTVAGGSVRAPRSNTVFIFGIFSDQFCLNRGGDG